MDDQLALYRDTGLDLAEDAGEITPVSWQPKRAITFEEYTSLLNTLQTVEGGVNWWIGDLLNYAEGRWGEMYAQAAEAIGWKYERLRNTKWVSSAIDLSLRNDKLSWSHHCAVAPLEPDAQEFWLQRAEDEEWSVSEMRKTMKGKVVAANSAPAQLGDDEEEYDGDEWYTPVELIEAARATMGVIDLDPASNDEAQETVNALVYFTKDDDGLSRPWHGNVWLNPPYSMPLIQQFVDKALAEFDAGNISSAILLTNNSSDTAWFHRLLTRGMACFHRGRVKFWRDENDAFGARQGQTLFYLGTDPDKFATVFSEFGVIVTQYDYQ